MLFRSRPIATKARKSIAGFKIRDDMAIGCKVTLRKERMYEFLERLIDIADIQIDDLIKALKNREFTVVRKWVVDNIDNDPVLILRRIYDSLYDYLKGPSIPEAVLIIAKYQQQVTQVADQEINVLGSI